MLDGLAHVAEVVGVGGGKRVDVVGRAHRVVDHRALRPSRNCSFRPIGSTGSSRSAKMMAASTSSISTGCSVTVAARSGRLQISRMPCLARISPVLLHVPAGLPHEPHGPHIRGPAPAGIQKTACHWSHAHGFSILSSQKNTRKSFGLCLAAHWRPLIKYGFAHASLSSVRGAITETESTALRRIAGPRVHDVGCRSCLPPGKTSRSCRMWTSTVLQLNFRQRLAADPRDR